ncbi:MAG: tail fiber protein [Bacillota bacterium]|nr:tail fiber protein [Bacillota bacterium]
MATVYGSKVNNVWRAYMTYTVTTTPTQVKVSITSGINIPNDGYSSHRSFTCTISGTSQTTVSGSISNKKYVGVLTKAIKSVTYTWNRSSTAQTKTIKTVLKGYDESTTSSCSASISVPALAPATITFNANNGSGTVPSAISTYVGVANTIPSNSLTRAGYTFDGWNTASDGSGTAYATGSTITPSGNVTLYAQWKTTYIKPEIQNLLAFRTANASGGVSPTVTSTGTTGFCKFQLVGGANYTFTRATVQFGTATAKSMTRSGNTLYGYSDPGSIAQASAYTVKITVVVTGADGISRTYTDSTYISKSVPVFDATPNSFALGGVARDVTGDEKPFDCYMHPIFYTMAGEIKMWAGDTIPDGWLLCDGSEVSKTKYPNLYAAIGDLWGVPNSSSNFKLPNLAGNVPVGYASADTDFDTVGKTGGKKTHTLTPTEMPSHHHGTSGWYNSVYKGTRSTETVGGIGGTGYLMTQVKDGGSWGGISSVKTAGDGAAHNNLQPYAVIKYVICAI